MPRLRVKATWDGQSWKVNLPEYIMVPGSWEPVTPLYIDEHGVLFGADPYKVLALQPTCEVDVPDRICDPDTGQLSKDRIRELYKGNKLWDNETVTDDL
jgi:hypothetical protein